jgi:hypothetical protein
MNRKNEVENVPYSFGYNGSNKAKKYKALKREIEN